MKAVQPLRKPCETLSPIVKSLPIQPLGSGAAHHSVQDQSKATTPRHLFQFRITLPEGGRCGVRTLLPALPVASPWGGPFEPLFYWADPCGCRLGDRSLCDLDICDSEICGSEICTHDISNCMIFIEGFQACDLYTCDLCIREVNSSDCCHCEFSSQDICNCKICSRDHSWLTLAQQELQARVGRVD